MLEKEKISPQQALFLMVITIVSTGMIFLPIELYNRAAQDSWLSIIFGAMIDVILIYIISKLGLMYRDKTIIEYSQVIFGKTLGKFAGLFVFLIFLFLNTVNLRQFAELTVGAFYPLAPTTFFVIAIILVSTFALYQGLEVIARVNEILLPFFFSFLFAILFFNIPEMNFQHLTPVLENGLIHVFQATSSQALWSVEFIVLAILIPSLSIPTKARRVSFLSLLIVNGFGLVLLTGVIAVFGKETGNLSFPFLSMGRMINIANFLERLDSFILAIWVAGGFVKITVFYYCAVLSLSQLLQLTEYRSLILPLGAIQTVFSIILWNNTAQLIFQLGTYINTIFTTGFFSLIISLFVVAEIKNHLQNKLKAS